MIKCNVKVCGIINRTASVKQTADGKNFVAFGLSVELPSTKGDAVPVNISVAAESADVEALTLGRRVSIDGVLKIKGAAEKEPISISRPTKSKWTPWRNQVSPEKWSSVVSCART